MFVSSRLQDFPSLPFLQLNFATSVAVSPLLPSLSSPFRRVLPPPLARSYVASPPLPNRRSTRRGDSRSLLGFLARRPIFMRPEIRLWDGTKRNATFAQALIGCSPLPTSLGSLSTVKGLWEFCVESYCERTIVRCSE